MEPKLQYRAAALQMTSGLDVSANLLSAGHLIETAVAQGAELIVLPEFFALIGRQRNDAFSIREQPGDGPIQSFLSEQANRHGVWIVGGSMPMAIANTQRIRAASLLFDSNGQRVARYDKIHLFDVLVEDDSKRIYQESAGVEPGNELVVADSPFGRIGLSVCYDMRFPEMFRAMASQAMDVLTVPSAFTVPTGRVHWEVLLRARAIENLCYVIAPAQVGQHEGGRETYGDSVIIDPWGKVLARLQDGNGVVVADIDIAHLRRLRSDFPALEHVVLQMPVQ